MHSYNRPILPNWHPAWMLIPFAVWAILLPPATSQECAMPFRIPTPHSVTRQSGAADSIASSGQ